MDLFKKSSIVGVAVTPEHGLEVAEIDFRTKTVLKYAAKQLAYNINNCQIADMDLFKDTLQELMLELSIPKNSYVVLSIPTVMLKMADYPAAVSKAEIGALIEEELLTNPFFTKNNDPCFSFSVLPNVSNQFNKVAYTAASLEMVSEVVYAIRNLGYKVYAIDTSASTTYSGLNYLGHFDNVNQETSWILMVVDNLSCRITTMIGREYTDVFEERISIGEILGDDENYASVVSAAEPILKNLPAKFLYIVSSTNLISAEALAGKLQYSEPIIHHEANNYSKEAVIDVAPTVDPNVAANISLDVIGAAIKKDFAPQMSINLNLYNESLGELYTMDQPPKIVIGTKEYILSNEFLFKLFLVIMIIFAIATMSFSFYILSEKSRKENQLKVIKDEINTIQEYLDKNKQYSGESFNEGDEIKKGLTRNRTIYSYYTIVGTEIPKKLWLTHLNLSDTTTIEGQADNLESVYSFFRNVKDYNPNSSIKLQKLGLASQANNSALNNEGAFDTESILTSFNADFYEFRISNAQEGAKSDTKKSDNKKLPDLEPLN